MSEYTPTEGGYQRMMDIMCTGKPEEGKAFAEEIITPDFYQMDNGKRIDREEWIDKLVDLRDKILKSEPVMEVNLHFYLTINFFLSLLLFHTEEFLREGDQLACRMTGIFAMTGPENETIEMEFESLRFVGVDSQSGKMTYIVERGVPGCGSI